MQPEELLDRTLSGTALLVKARYTLAESRRHYETIFKPYVFDAFPALYEPAAVTFDRYLWVLGLAWSRGFGLKPPASAKVRGGTGAPPGSRLGPTDALPGRMPDRAVVGDVQADGMYDVVCPVACFVNHGSSPATVNAEVSWNVDAANLQIRTTRPVAAGDEVRLPPLPRAHPRVGPASWVVSGNQHAEPCITVR